jgi:ring-1,2-phenylacetyl-CoA epoxidase subunit PaaC
MSKTRTDGFKSADALPESAREALAASLLSLADNKRILGMRYGEWILGAPTLEAGIACSAMAQDEWGHARILYATLKDFEFEPNVLEHERPADEYLNSELLDEPVTEWPDLLALNLLLDSALSVQVEAMTESSYEPILFKTRKLLEEERFHFEHGRGWAMRLGDTGAGRKALEAAYRKAVGPCLRWFGRPDSEFVRQLVDAGVMNADSDELRRRWRERITPVFTEAGLEIPESGEAVVLEWEDWDADRRRAAAGALDEVTLARIRGDKNRSMLMD